MTKTVKFKVAADPVLVRIQNQRLDSVSFIDVTEGDGTFVIESGLLPDTFTASVTLTAKEQFKFERNLPVDGDDLKIYHRFSCTGGVIANVTIVSPFDIELINFGSYTASYPYL